MTKAERIVTREVERFGFRLISLERDGDDLLAMCQKGSFGRQACFMFTIEEGKIYFVKDVSIQD